MKRLMSMIAVLVLVCFSTMAFAADMAKPANAAKPALAATPATPATPAQPAKVEKAKPEIIKGTIESIDTAKNEITVKGKTIVVKPEELAMLKKGETVKVMLAPGTNNAEKITVEKAKAALKKTVVKETKAEQKPAEKKAE